MSDPLIYLSFRFHGNFYHSYRGDTPDELGFGKDMRIIRHIIQSLDDLNQRGIPIKGTWDFENYFSLETIMPEHCPDIIEGLKRRVQEHDDEMHLMSYNNGLVSAHTAEEFREAIVRGISNPQGSGLRDLFGEGFFPMVRPQEMLFTPIHLKLYKALGIEAISLYYSAIPFNGFSNFVPLLSPAKRYNPLTLTYPGIDESMTLLPCYNHGDLIDHLTLRRWVKQMRRQQISMKDPLDFILLIDLDADDELWVGFDVPFIKKVLSTAQGLTGIVQSVLDLEYLRFTTPGRYLQDHASVGEISFGQDTGDGSFDGLSSWAEKFSNQRIWTGLERGRILGLQTQRLLQGEMQAPIQEILKDGLDTRLKILSTTHFGMSAPVMNATREKIAHSHVCTLVSSQKSAFEMAKPDPTPGRFSLLDYTRGVSTDELAYQAKPSKSLIRLKLKPDSPSQFLLKNAVGEEVPHAVIENNGLRELVFTRAFDPAGRCDFIIEEGHPQHSNQSPVEVDAVSLENDTLQVQFNDHGQVTAMKYKGKEVGNQGYLTSSVRYAGSLYRIEQWTQTESKSSGVVGYKRLVGRVKLNNRHELTVEREFLLAAGLPYLYLSTTINYPKTPHRGYNRQKALRLQRTWDNAWQEVMPCEIYPSILGSSVEPLRVWKHNYFDHISKYDLDYERFSNNNECDSINNQVTHAWVAVSDGENGLLLAQNADVNCGMAFCPMRTRLKGGKKTIRLNPFGTYTGRQYQYATQDTGIGKALAVGMSASDHIQPYAPSYNGRRQVLSLLIAPYEGDCPPSEIQQDAEAFAYPYLVLNDLEFLADPPHCSWEG